MVVLVIEDNAVTGSSLTELIRKAGHVAEWASSMVSAETKAPVIRPDVVLLDLSLPDVTSPQEALERSRALAGSPRVVVLTALAESDLPPLRDSSVLLKPTDPEEIVSEMLVALSKSCPPTKGT